VAEPGTSTFTNRSVSWPATGALPEAVAACTSPAYVGVEQIPYLREVPRTFPLREAEASAVARCTVSATATVSSLHPASGYLGTNWARVVDSRSTRP